MSDPISPIVFPPPTSMPIPEIPMAGPAYENGKFENFPKEPGEIAQTAQWLLHIELQTTLQNLKHYLGQCPAKSPFWLVFQVFNFFLFSLNTNELLFGRFLH